VLIADNSSFARLVMTDILNAEPGIQVVDTANDGEEMLSKARICKPDVVVFDIDIPKSGKFSVLRRMMEERPAALVLSGKEDKMQDRYLLQSITQCAYEILIKPDGVVQPPLRAIGEELVEKVKRAATSGIKPALAFMEEYAAAPERSDIATEDNFHRPRRLNYVPASHLIIIGASTGGAVAIEYILSKLPADFPAAILIAQHMPPSFTSTFTRRLDSLSSLKTEEGMTGMRIEAGSIIIAQGESHMIVNTVMGNKDQLRVDYTSGEENTASQYDRPSIDLLMRSAAAAYDRKCLGVILSGMGRDGCEGARYIREKGGSIIAQDQNTSVIFGMAKAAIEEGVVDKVLPLHDIPRYLDFYVRHDIQ
jgi:two-component system chemotaxis response regulator CheB